MIEILDAKDKQRFEWRMRIIEAVLARNFDDETVVTMLMTGFEQAHQEGLIEASDHCFRIGAAANPTAAGVCKILGDSIRKVSKVHKGVP